jgi:hypothetical protein
MDLSGPETLVEKIKFCRANIANQQEQLCEEIASGDFKNAAQTCVQLRWDLLHMNGILEEVIDEDGVEGDSDNLSDTRTRVDPASVPYQRASQVLVAVPTSPKVGALEQISRKRGGSQSHLMRCGDGNYYVVKFQNNAQHRRILVNEFLGTNLAARIGLPTTPVAIVEVSEELIRLTDELVIEMPRNRIPCQAGLQFGSRYPGDPRRLALLDFLPDEQLRHVVNLPDFLGMLVFDKWTCNTDGRQTLFFQEDAQAADVIENQAASSPYRTVMIDQGFCFNAGEWNFPDAPLRGLYARQRVYENVIGMESFAPWLERLESINECTFDEIIRQIPPEWYEDDYNGLVKFSEQLLVRRSHVPELIVSARNSNRQPFPNWIPKTMSGYGA